MEIIHLICQLCRRTTATPSPYGVIGIEGLRIIGWDVNHRGKPICDYCTDSQDKKKKEDI